MNQDSIVKALPGPILIIGASGFIGANILRRYLAVRDDVIGTFFAGDPWRLRGIPATNVAFLNLQDPVNVMALLHRVRPKTILDCSSYGAYSFEQDYQRIHTTNYMNLINVLEQAEQMDISAYVHAGSSSEYGLNATNTVETDAKIPNSHYAVSKAAASNAVSYYGKVKGLPIVNLRLYSVYGPYEDSSRLIPVICEHSLQGQLPGFGRPDITRDFVHVDDVVDAFTNAVILMNHEIRGESFNIGTGHPTSLRSLVNLVKTLFNIDSEPIFDPSLGRAWDVDKWYANTEKAKNVLNWQAKIALEQGLTATRDWWESYLIQSNFSKLTKRGHPASEKNSITAIVACYKDEQAIPVMYERLVAVFNRLRLDYEIIFVNDGSPDNSTEVIKELSARDPHVIGIYHSRNFGSQAAFRSGMELASKKACVLLDGDLQDPPEVIDTFVAKWRDEDADVVYGRRVKREMPVFLEACYRMFYRLFAALSEVPIPKDAGDFSLIDSSVVYWILQCQERDVFLRGLRAYVGFKQVGVDYVRPERMFGKSTNNWIKNIGWAKKGIFSFSRMPLHLLTALGTITTIGAILLAIWGVFVRIFNPDQVPKGMTFISLIVMFFGSFTILGLGLLGEYIGKIFEETKARPAFIRRSIIVRGHIKPAIQSDHGSCYYSDISKDKKANNSE